jgi:putative ABC transport system permease protein
MDQSFHSSDVPGPAYISPLQVALGAAVIIVNAGISVGMNLGIEKHLLVGAARCVVQLTVLGYILVPIFSYHLWYLVVGYSLVMLLVGSWEASSRPPQTYKGMFLHIMCCIGASASLFICYTLLLVVRTHPWWQAQYFIPILGMLLGNAISGVSVGLSTVVDEFASGRDRVELLLSIGASRWEATREAISKSVRLACMPILNQMNVVGIVSIPGMMTGQILSGSDPSQAARYQMIVMFIIASTASVASVGTITLAAFSIVDKQARLRSDLLTMRERHNSWTAQLQSSATKTCASAGQAVKRVFQPSRGASEQQEDASEPLLHR